MTKTTRRSALRLVAAGSAAAALSAQDGNEHKHGNADDEGAEGANATISFGQWLTTPPLDRFGTVPGSANGHLLIPSHVTIKAGGTVTFVIAGFHNVAIYDDGAQPRDIDTTRLMGNLIDDPTKRIYRGLNPAMQSQDRVEVVSFSKPGTFLVICAVLSHFNGGMFGFVKVVASED